MKESYMNLIFDREHLLMVAEMYNCSFEREHKSLEDSIVNGRLHMIP